MADWSGWIGWLATGLFCASYFFKHPVRLRVVQAVAASVWIGYGILVHAPPVIVANALIVAIATLPLWTLIRRHMGFVLRTKNL